MLYQLKEYGFPLDQSFSTPSSPHPVTELQELLQKRHIRSPSYAYVPHDGTHGHMKEYTCICRVEKFNLGKFQNIESKVTAQSVRYLKVAGKGSKADDFFKVSNTDIESIH